MDVLDIEDNGTTWRPPLRVPRNWDDQAPAFAFTPHTSQRIAGFQQIDNHDGTFWRSNETTIRYNFDTEQFEDFSEESDEYTNTEFINQLDRTLLVNAVFPQYNNTSKTDEYLYLIVAIHKHIPKYCWTTPTKLSEQCKPENMPSIKNALNRPCHWMTTTTTPRPTTTVKTTTTTRKITKRRTTTTTLKSTTTSEVPTAMPSNTGQNEMTSTYEKDISSTFTERVSTIRLNNKTSKTKLKRTKSTTPRTAGAEEGRRSEKDKPTGLSENTYIIIGGAIVVAIMIMATALTAYVLLSSKEEKSNSDQSVAKSSATKSEVIPEES